MKCPVCGTEYPAIHERHYVSRDLSKTGLVAAIASTDEPALYDTYDCPHCGCQNVAQPRKRDFVPYEYSDEDLLEEVEPCALAAHLGITERQLETLYAAKAAGNRVRIKERKGSAHENH